MPSAQSLLAQTLPLVPQQNLEGTSAVLPAHGAMAGVGINGMIQIVLHVPRAIGVQAASGIAMTVLVREATLP